MKRVLIIEDDKDIVELVRYNLEKDGYQVISSGDGATGLAQVVELAAQLRGRAGTRQVRGARLGLAVNTGGIIEGDAGFVGIHAVRAGSS